MGRRDDDGEKKGRRAGTGNIINDERPAKTWDDRSALGEYAREVEEQGEGDGRGDGIQSIRWCDE